MNYEPHINMSGGTVERSVNLRTLDPVSERPTCTRNKYHTPRWYPEKRQQVQLDDWTITRFCRHLDRSMGPVTFSKTKREINVAFRRFLKKLTCYFTSSTIKDQRKIRFRVRSVWMNLSVMFYDQNFYLRSHIHDGGFMCADCMSGSSETRTSHYVSNLTFYLFLRIFWWRKTNFQYCF